MNLSISIHICVQKNKRYTAYFKKGLLPYHTLYIVTIVYVNYSFYRKHYVLFSVFFIHHAMNVNFIKSTRNNLYAIKDII